MSAHNGGSIKVPGQGSITKGAVGVTVTVKPNLTQGSTNIPKNSAGKNPRFVRLMCEQSWGTAQCYVNFGTQTNLLTPSLSGLLVTSQCPQILDVTGASALNATTRSSSAKLNVIPIDE